MRAVSPKVLYRYGVFPGNLVFCDAERSRQSLTLRRTRSVVAAYDCCDQFCIQSCAFDQLVQTDPHLFHVPCDRFHIHKI